MVRRSACVIKPPRGASLLAARPLRSQPTRVLRRREAGTRCNARNGVDGAHNIVSAERRQVAASIGLLASQLSVKWAAVAAEVSDAPQADAASVADSLPFALFLMPVVYGLYSIFSVGTSTEDERTEKMMALERHEAFVRQQEAEAAAALASRQESAQEWIENWRASTAALAIAEEERAVAAQATLEGMNLVEDDAKADRVVAASAWIANWREASEAKVVDVGTAVAAVSLTSAQAAASSVAPIKDAPGPINVDALRWTGESSAADVSVDVDALRWVGEDTSAPYPAAPAAPSPPAPAVNVDALRWAGEEEGTVLPRLTRPLAPNTVDNMRRLRDVVSTQERRALRRQIEMAEAPPMPSAPPTPSLAVTIQRIVRLVAESLLFLVVAIVGRITAFVQGSGRPKAA